MANAPQYANKTLYWGTVTDTAFGQSKTKGTPELAVRFAIDGQVNPKDPTGQLLPCPIAERTAYLYFTKGNIEFTMRDLETLGFDGDSFAQLGKEHPEHVSLIGRECAFLCTHDPYEGTVREKWSVSAPRTLEAGAPIEDSEVAKLDAMFGSALKKCKQRVQAKREQPAENDVTQVEDGVAF